MSDLMPQLATQAQPWFENFGLVGGLLGAGIGTLGAAYGTTVGLLAPRGKARGARHDPHDGLSADRQAPLSAGGAPAPGGRGVPPRII
jgi:hypothetical protein